MPVDTNVATQETNQKSEESFRDNVKSLEIAKNMEEVYKKEQKPLEERERIGSHVSKDEMKLRVAKIKNRNLMQKIFWQRFVFRRTD